jgi:hypothetical protein
VAVLPAQRGKPYPPIYIEAVGALDSPREGFARDWTACSTCAKWNAYPTSPKECG